MNTSFTFTKIKLEEGQDSNSELTHLNLGLNNLSDPIELVRLKIFPRIRKLILAGNRFEVDNITLIDVLPLLETVNVYGTGLDCIELR